MKPAWLNFLLLTLLFLGCNKQPAVPKAIEGLYRLDPKSGAYTGYTFRLSDGVFAYEWFTDALDSPRLKENPQCGHFTLTGSDIKLTFSDGNTSHLVLTKGSSGYMLWWPEEYKEYLRTKKIPLSVLYQQKH